MGEEGKLADIVELVVRGQSVSRDRAHRRLAHVAHQDLAGGEQPVERGRVRLSSRRSAALPTP